MIWKSISADNPTCTFERENDIKRLRMTGEEIEYIFKEYSISAFYHGHLSS